MDELPNTHYISSFFEVTPSGRQLIISQFRDEFPDVFVGYKNSANAFFINTNDDRAIDTLISIFQTQVNLFMKGQYGDTPESPTMLPLKHTTLPVDANNVMAATTQINKLDLNALVDLNEDSEDSSESTSLSGDSSTYWAPKSGNLEILQRDLMNDIADVTGCIFCPEPEHRRVRFICGNTQAALAKLRRLEPLLERLARCGSSPTPRVDHNILSLSCQAKGTGVCYVPTTQSPHCQRVKVGPTLEDRVEFMFVGEEQVYDESTGKYTKAENLNVIHTRDDPAVPSNIWANHQLKSFGSPENARPTASSPGTSVVSSINISRPNEHMGIVEQARVRDWSKNIDVGADPTQALSVPALFEPVIREPAPVRTVAKPDSDDEDNLAGETTYRVVAEDSDDEVTSSVTKNQGYTQRNLRDGKAQQSLDRNYTTSNARVDRLNRRRDYNRNDEGLKATGNARTFVAASSFFANVPRDEDGLGEARFRATTPSFESGQPVQPVQTVRLAQSSQPLQPTQSAQSLQPSQPVSSAYIEPGRGNTPTTTRRGRPSRGFGYDGAEDDQDQSPEQNYNPSKTSNSSSVSTADVFQQADQTRSYKPGAGFDPSQYGADRKAGEGSLKRIYPTQQNTLIGSQSQQYAVPTWPRPPLHGGVNAGTRRGDEPPAQSWPSDQLIDYSGELPQQPTNVMPPPGLSPSKRIDEFAMIESPHLLDSPLDEIQRPVIRPSWDYQHVPQHGEPSISTSSSSGTRHFVPEYNAQTKINKPNIGYMRNSMVDELLALQVKKKHKKEAPKATVIPSERIDPENEPTTRVFYNTMNLGAPNRGRGQKGRGSDTSNGETRAQAAERVAKTKAELGIASAPAKKPLLQRKEPEKENLSKKAKQAAKSNPEMAKLHAGSLEVASRKRIAQDFVEQMKAAYKLARLFPGHIELEFQIGQLLAMPSTRFKANHVYEMEKWKSIFNSGVTSVEVFFTNTLTTSGSDVDGILEARNGRTKIWNKYVPGPCSVELEFECQDSSGTEFVLHLNTDGTHWLSKNSFVVKQIGLHCSGRTWDACAVLKGVPASRDIPVALQNSVTDLIASVYMETEGEFELFFRTPSDSSITVREVTVKKTSRHDSQLPGEKDVQLKIIEVKTLYMTNHRKDKRLTRCLEKSHGEMARNDRLHYEVSVVDIAINLTFEKNQGLEVGEMTSLEQSDSTPLDYKRILCVLDSALSLVDKIDWVGGHNVGSTVQQQYVRLTREEEATRSMPPTMLDHNFFRPVHLPGGLSMAAPRSVLGPHTIIGCTTGGNTQMSVHGIRSGTRAQVVTDRDGNYFRIGLGGARIPIDIQEEASAAGDVVAPDDSASQIGRSNRNARGVDAARPEGFW